MGIDTIIIVIKVVAASIVLAAAVLFIVVLFKSDTKTFFKYLFSKKRLRKELRDGGIKATARIVEVREFHNYANRNPIHTLEGTLEVTAPDGTKYQLDKNLLNTIGREGWDLPLSFPCDPGAEIPIKIHPNRPDLIMADAKIIDWWVGVLCGSRSSFDASDPAE